MRRALFAIVVAALAAGAVLIPAPPDAGPPLGDRIIDRPGLVSSDTGGIWYCPWAQATATRDTFLAIASTEETTATFTFPVTIPGEPADTAQLATLAPGGAGLDLSDVAQRGDSPSFIEFSGGPAAVASTVRGDVVAADACVSSGPDTWVFPGGSTLAGEELTLRLFNPFPEAARVTVTAVSDIGVEALGELRLISVAARSWRDISFEELLRQRADLTVTVTVDDGLVIPAMALRSGEDEDWWPGTGLADTWEFPAAGLAGLEASIVLANPGPTAVEVTVVFFDAEGADQNLVQVSVPGESPLRIPVVTAAGDRAALVSASGPIAAAIVATGEAGTVVTPGLPAAARSWLAPGLRGVGLETGTLWLLNSSEEPTTVTVSALSGAGLVGERLTLAPSTQTAVTVADDDAVGFIVQAADPITVAWSITGPSGSGLAVASPVTNE